MRLGPECFNELGHAEVTAEMADRYGMTACDIQRLLGPAEWDALSTWHGPERSADYGPTLPVLLGGADEEESPCVWRLDNFRGFPVFLVDVDGSPIQPGARRVVVVLGVGRGAPYVGPLPVGH